jgi:hypothetical protein
MATPDQVENALRELIKGVKDAAAAARRAASPNDHTVRGIAESLERAAGDAERKLGVK